MPHFLFPTLLRTKQLLRGNPGSTLRSPGLRFLILCLERNARTDYESPFNSNQFCSAKIQRLLPCERVQVTPKQLLQFALIMVLAAAVRFAGISFDSLWLDESYQTLVGAYGHGAPDFLHPATKPYRFTFSDPAPVPEMLRRFREVDPLCPPLHAVLLNRWLVLWGDADLAVRSLSALLSLLSIVVVFAIATSLFGVDAALLAALVQALSPFDVHYAQEARMYSLVVLAAAASTGSLLALLQQDSMMHDSCAANRRPGSDTLAGARALLEPGCDDSPHRQAPTARTRTLLCVAAAATYAVCAWALVNSHYTGLFVACFQAVLAAGWMVTTRRWKLALYLVPAAVTVLFLWLPWLPMFFQSASSRKESFYVSREASLWWPFYALFVRVPVNWEVFLAGPRVGGYAIPVYVTSALSMISAAVASYFSARKKVIISGVESGATRQGSSDFPFPALLAVWLWALLPAGILWFLDVLEGRKVVEIARYTIGSAPAVYILAGLGMLAFVRRWRKGIVLIVLHCLFCFANLYYLHSVHQREPWRDMAAAVERVCRPDDLLVVSEFYDIACLDRYLTRPFRQIGVSPAMGKEYLAGILAGRDRFILLTAQQGEFIKDMIPAEYSIIERVDLRHGLHLRIYQK